MTEQTKENKPEQKQEAQTAGLIDNANKAAERLEAANQKQEELLNRQEELMARQRLGGQSEAGSMDTPVKEDSPKEYADKVTRGEVKPK